MSFFFKCVPFSVFSLTHANPTPFFFFFSISVMSRYHGCKFHLKSVDYPCNLPIDFFYMTVLTQMGGRGVHVTKCAITHCVLHFTGGRVDVWMENYKVGEGWGGSLLYYVPLLNVIR